MKVRTLAIGAALTAVLCATGASGFAADRTERTAAEIKKTLRAVALLYRHSVISPKYALPKVAADWPMGFQQLTELGTQDMFDRGRELRAKYVDELGLVSGTYNTREVYVRASNAERALQSAQMLMLGMFPIGSGDRPAASFRPVPIHSVALEDDRVMRPWTGQADCKRYRSYVKSFPNTKLYQEQGERYRSFLTRVAAATGVNEGQKPAKILYQINEISEPLASMARHKMPLPDGITEADLDQMKALGDWNYHHQFLGKSVGRITGGSFVEEVLKQFQAYVKRNGDYRKFFLYSGHQRTMLGVDAALNIEDARTSGALYKGRVPPLASHYAFELHETGKGDYAIRFAFVSDDGEQEIVIPGCETAMCPLARFEKTVSEVIPDNWRRECSK